MGVCGGGATNAPAIEKPKNLTIYGNVLDNQSRTLMALCNLANIKPIIIDIDYLNPEAM
jgi:hypothetical protein